MRKTTALILAAGRGSRMKGLTDAVPKCLLPLGGKTLLEWQLSALRRAGVERVVVVRGYKKELLEGDFATVDNPRWAETNMVQSLLCALSAAPPVPTGQGKDVLVAYADIVYKPEHVQALLAAQGEMALTYDTDWLDLWSLRQDDPLNDAETFLEEGGRLLAIGGKPQSLDEVRGQYMGLLKFSAAALERIVGYVRSLPDGEADRLDMTSLLRGLLAAGESIEAVPVSGGWCECDTAEDIARYETAMLNAAWAHDWR